jgi:hypothetical protein
LSTAEKDETPHPKKKIRTSPSFTLMHRLNSEGENTSVGLEDPGAHSSSAKRNIDHQLFVVGFEKVTSWNTLGWVIIRVKPWAHAKMPAMR